jgi:hypothetical protein
MDQIIVILDEICPQHGGHTFVYQYEDENFERWESVCEECARMARRPRATRLVPQGARSERPARPTHPREFK